MRPLPAVARMAGLGLGAAGLVLLATTPRQWERRARTAADATVARAVAGYLALTIDTTSQGDFRAARLLSGASIAGRAAGREGGLQVVWRGAPLLPDELRLARLRPAALAALERRETTTANRVEVGPVAVVPLLTPGDSSIIVGWVAAWDTTPREATGPMSPLVWAGAAALAAAALLSMLARGPLTHGVALALGVGAASAALLGARQADRQLVTGADRIAAATLQQARLVLALAAHQTGAPVERLARLTPGFTLRGVRAPPDSGAGPGVARIAVAADSTLEIAAPAPPPSLAGARLRLALAAGLGILGAALATWRTARHLSAPS